MYRLEKQQIFNGLLSLLHAWVNMKAPAYSKSDYLMIPGDVCLPYLQTDSQHHCGYVLLTLHTSLNTLCYRFKYYVRNV